VPFARPSAADATVASFSGNTVQFSGPPGWTNGQFVYVAGSQSNTYYFRINGGALEGRYYDITNNTSNSVTLDLKGDSLAGLSAGDAVSVLPHWTLGTVFVNGRGIHPTTDPEESKTEVLIRDSAGAGINLGAAATYYFYTNAGTAAWRQAGSASPNRNDDVLAPNVFLIIRHKVPTNTVFTSFGDVILTKVAIPLRGNPINRQDNPVAMPRPVDLTPNDTGLIESGAFVPTLNPGARKDELLVFDNFTTNFNRSAVATYYYHGSAWRQVGSTADHGTSNVFSPGAGFIIRKASGGSSTTWTNAPTY
jgi:uncharacterized protein (TIGR02597 family)